MKIFGFSVADFAIWVSVEKPFERLDDRSNGPIERSNDRSNGVIRSNGKPFERSLEAFERSEFSALLISFPYSYFLLHLHDYMTYMLGYLGDIHEA